MNETFFKNGHLLALGHVALYALIDQLQLDYTIIMLGAMLVFGRSS